MPDTPRIDEIQSGIVTRLQGVTVANGYHTDAGGNVHPDFELVKDITTFPALAIWYLGDARQPDPDVPFSHNEVIARYWVFAAVAKATEATRRSDVAKLLDDVVVALEGDQTLGGLTYVTSNSGRNPVQVERRIPDVLPGGVERRYRTAGVQLAVTYLAALGEG